MICSCRLNGNLEEVEIQRLTVEGQHEPLTYSNSNTEQQDEDNTEEQEEQLPPLGQEDEKLVKVGVAVAVMQSWMDTQCQLLKDVN